MGTQKKTYPIVLAVRPTVRGIAYAVFEKPDAPLDWGHRRASGNKNEGCKTHLESLLDLHEPDVLVLDTSADGRTSQRIPRLIRAFERIAARYGVRVARQSRDNVKAVFGQFGRTTKFCIARTIKDWLPDLRNMRLQCRKPWMSEHYSMAIFDAIAFAITYYYIND